LYSEQELKLSQKYQRRPLPENSTWASPFCRLLIFAYLVDRNKYKIHSAKFDGVTGFY
jgi:hypothetical protein